MSFPSLLFCTQLILIDNFFSNLLKSFSISFKLIFPYILGSLFPNRFKFGPFKTKMFFNLFTKYPYNSILKFIHIIYIYSLIIYIINLNNKEMKKFKYV